MSTGHPLALRRAALGLSQGALAARAGLSRESVCKIESGRQKPSLATALALGRALAFDPVVLFPNGGCDA